MPRGAIGRSILAGIAALCSALGGCEAAPSAGAIPLVVASDLDNPPFAWVDEGGEPRGRDVEMMEAIAADLGRKLVWKRLPFERLLPACERGQVDLVCATLGRTPERAARFLLTRPYFATTLELVVRAGPGEPSSAADLAGKAVHASPGTTSAHALARRLPQAMAVLGKKSDRGGAEELLRARKVDAAVMDGPAARALVERSGGFLRLLEAPLEREDYVLVLPRSRSTLRAAIDALLADLERSRILDQLDRAHGLVPASGQE